MSGEPRTLTIDGVTLRLRLVRKRVKNINARLVGDELRVSAPPWVANGDLEDAVSNLAHRLVRRRRERAVNREQNALALARRVARRFPDPPTIAEARFSTNQRARWGSYSLRTRTIRLNAALRQMPDWVLEGVVAHELAHVAFPNHSAEFWGLLKTVCPETDRVRAFLEGVHWLAGSWDELPLVERSLLVGSRSGLG